MQTPSKAKSQAAAKQETSFALHLSAEGPGFETGQPTPRPYRAFPALSPSAQLVRIVRLVRTFFQTAVVAAKRQDAQIIIRKFDHLDKTKDLADVGSHGPANRHLMRGGIVFARPYGRGAAGGKSQKGVFDSACGGGRWSGILDRHETGLSHPNKEGLETQSHGAYFEHDRPRSRPITLVGIRKVSPIGHLDRPHVSAWRRDGAPSLLSWRVGRPARRTKALAGARGNTPKLAAPHFFSPRIGSSPGDPKPPTLHANSGQAYDGRPIGKTTHGRLRARASMANADFPQFRA